MANACPLPGGHLSEIIMKKIWLVLLCIAFNTNGLASPVINISDRCSCFSKDGFPFVSHIDHCESTPSPRLIGVAKDQVREEVYISEPGETVDIPLKDESGNDMVGVRYPGPSKVISGGGAIHATSPTNTLPITYAIPIYINKIPNGGNHYESDQVILLKQNEFNLATCTYLPEQPLNPTEDLNPMDAKVK